MHAFSCCYLFPISFEISCFLAANQNGMLTHIRWYEAGRVLHVANPINPLQCVSVCTKGVSPQGGNAFTANFWWKKKSTVQKPKQILRNMRLKHFLLKQYCPLRNTWPIKFQTETNMSLPPLRSVYFQWGPKVCRECERGAPRSCDWLITYIHNRTQNT